MLVLNGYQLGQIQQNLSRHNPFGHEEFVMHGQVFGLHWLKLNIHLVDGTISLSGLGRFSAYSWFRQVSVYLLFYGISVLSIYEGCP